MLFALSTTVFANSSSSLNKGGHIGLVELKGNNAVTCIFTVPQEYVKEDLILNTSLRVSIYDQNGNIVSEQEIWSTYLNVSLPEGNYVVYMQVGSSSGSKLVEW